MCGRRDDDGERERRSRGKKKWTRRFSVCHNTRMDGVIAGFNDAMDVLPRWWIGCEYEEVVFGEVQFSYSV